MFTISPLCRFAISGMTAFAMRHIPNTLVSKARWTCSMSWSIVAPGNRHQPCSIPISTCTWHDQACIVDQDVNSPLLLNDLLYNFLDLVILRNIEGKLFYRRFIFEIPKS